MRFYRKFRIFFFFFTTKIPITVPVLHRNYTTYLDSDVSIENTSRVQHDGATFVDPVIFSGDILNQQTVNVLNESVSILNPGLLLVPIDQRRGVGLDLASNFITGAGDRILFGRSVYPRDIVYRKQTKKKLLNQILIGIIR